MYRGVHKPGTCGEHVFVRANRMRKTRRRSGKTRSRWGPQSLVHGLLRGSSSWRVAWRHGLRGSASRRRSISHSPGRRSFLLRIPPLSSLHSPLFPEVSLLPCPSSDSYATLILFSFPFRLFHYFPPNSFFSFCLLHALAVIFSFFQLGCWFVILRAIVWLSLANFQ